MKIYRTVEHYALSVPTMEGAGVALRRAFGFSDPKRFDPFLLLDDFRGDDPADYIAGFPWHPHRGIETITYMLEGSVEHGDSLGNKGVIEAGGVQWMTAGSGIVHQEMPKPGPNDRMGGFQLWANLPAKDKMMDPRYRELTVEQIPEVAVDKGRIKVIAGKVGDVVGPVADIVIEPEYLDLNLEPDSVYEHPSAPGKTQFAYVVSGDAGFDPPQGDEVTDPGVTAQIFRERTVVLFGDGDTLRIHSADIGARVLLVAGKPLGEPIAWRGPIVMNTEEELRRAFEEYRRGTFIKTGK